MPTLDLLLQDIIVDTKEAGKIGRVADAENKEGVC